MRGFIGLTPTLTAVKQTDLDWSQYRGENTVPTSPLHDGLATAPSVPVRFANLVGPLSYFSFQPVFHNWYNKTQFLSTCLM